MKIEFRRKKATVWKPRKFRRLEEAATLAQETASPADIDGWERQTLARVRFAHLWYMYKFRRDGVVDSVDFLAYKVMTAI